MHKKEASPHILETRKRDHLTFLGIIIIVIIILGLIEITVLSFDFIFQKIHEQ